MTTGELQAILAIAVILIGFATQIYKFGAKIKGLESKVEECQNYMSSHKEQNDRVIRIQVLVENSIKEMEKMSANMSRLESKFDELAKQVHSKVDNHVLQYHKGG